MPASSDEKRQAQELGARAEAYVADQLVSEGWNVLARNWRGGGGELDLVVERGGALRIVEVKARAPDDDVGLEAIHEDKRRRLVQAAEAWLSAYEVPFDEVCFLAVLVEANPDGWEITWIDNAFDA